MTIDHEHFSGLLASYVRGDLAAEEARDVEEHLAVCEECELERRGLVALLADPEEAQPLTEMERARLHRSLAALRPSLGGEVVAARRSPWARLAPALGAAALLVFAVFGLTQVDLGGGDDSDSAGQAASEEEALEQALPEVGVDVGGGTIARPGREERTFASNLTADQEDAAAGAGGEEAAENQQAAVPVTSARARFDPSAGRFTDAELRRYAARQPPFTTFLRYYRAEDVTPSLAAAYLEGLVGAAASESDDRSIRACGEQVLRQDLPILPVYAAFGRLEERPVLVTGFVFARAETLDRYLVWVWPRGDCEIPVLTIDGNVRP